MGLIQNQEHSEHEMSEPARQIKRIRIEPKTGAAFQVARGQLLRVIDVDGGQVVDLFCFSEIDRVEKLSSGHTTDYNGKIMLSTGDTLYSSSSQPMFTIQEDKVGGHIMLYAPCSQAMYEKSYGVNDPHPNCLDNFCKSLENYRIDGDKVTVPLNIFMRVVISGSGEIEIRKPDSEAGDYIDLLAEMDMIVAVSVCPAGICNNYTWTPIDVELYDSE